MRIPPLVTLVVALALLALASPLVKWLVEHGGETGIVRPNAISFCNVLFVGNACAGLTTLALFGPRRILAGLRRSSWKARWLMVVGVGFAIAIPWLLFEALQTTTVTNLILLGRFESVALAVFAWVLFGQALSRRQIVGYLIIVIGILALVLIQGMARLTTGDRLVMIAAALQGLAACPAKVLLERVSVRTFVFVRNFVSAIVFFWIAVGVYGFGHFAQALAPGLWGAMLVYGLAVVAVAQLAWYRSLRALAPGTVASWSMLMPPLAIAFAYLLLKEVPTTAQVIGGVVIAAGLLISRIKQPAAAEPQEQLVEKSLAAA